MRDDKVRDGHANSGHSMIWTQTGTTIIEVMVAVVLGLLKNLLGLLLLLLLVVSACRSSLVFSPCRASPRNSRFMAPRRTRP